MIPWGRQVMSPFGNPVPSDDVSPHLGFIPMYSQKREHCPRGGQYLSPDLRLEAISYAWNHSEP